MRQDLPKVIDPTSGGSNVLTIATPRVSTADVRARMALNADRPADAASDLRVGDDLDGSTMTLRSKEIRLYNKNPRRSINPRYDEIKESIKVKGVLNQISVTRRPDSKEYMVYGGGNTRLQIVQELCDEFPGNPLYSHMRVVFRAWKTESDVLTAHLIENDARGDTSFWDKACGLIALKKELESESQGFLSANELRLKAAALGLKVSRETIQLYDFSVERLAVLGIWLRFNSARQLRERIGALSTLANRLDLQRGEALIRGLTDEVLSQHANTLAAKQENTDLLPTVLEVDSGSIVAALDERLCTEFNIPNTKLKQMLALLSTNPLASATLLFSDSARPSDCAPIGNNAAPGYVAPSQVPLPTAILSSVNGPATPLPATTAGSPELSRSAHSQPQPPNSAPSTSVSAEVADSSYDSANSLLEAVKVLAAATYNSALFRTAPAMPLGYFMEPPEAALAPLPESPMPAPQQVRLRRAGWQLLATLSCQFDARCCNESTMPSSSWLDVVQGGHLEVALQHCGVLIHSGRVQLDADCLFFALTEPALLNPGVTRILQSIAKRWVKEKSLLPIALQQVCTPKI